MDRNHNHAHRGVDTQTPPTPDNVSSSVALGRQVSARLVGPCPAASVVSCHLFREEDLSFWLYFWTRGERECSLTKSSGNLYWGNMVSRKPSKKT